MALGSLGFCTSAAVDESGHGREWLEVAKLDLPIANLPEYFHGKILVQISDLHCSTTVSPAYLKRCIARVNQLKPDIIALTGDYITYDKRGLYKDKLIKMLAAMKAPLGIYACLGNHDYGVFEPKRNFRLADLIKEIKSAGITLLRNEATYIQFGRKRLWIVGLGDIWVNDCKPHKAFGAVPAAGPAIALVHNPEAIEHLQDWHADVILSGHTHGSSMEIPIAANLPIKQRKLISGLMNVGRKTLYINRGLGRHGRPRLRCRPEITVFKLVSLSAGN
ncbi:MAG: hypothetical protein A2Y07_02240 [Planctomycetes bacterium GWF2_50_10]|nr:MAG: hypothetical protein A2Y07_02240 [Planctomycetes bacterium GWF2_50_10]